MRDDEGGNAQQRWMQDRMGGDVEDHVAGTGGPWPVSGDPTPGAVESPANWWEGLAFDPRGKPIPWEGKNLTAAQLVPKSRDHASVVKDYLEDEPAAADINNRACASIYLEAMDVDEPRAALEAIKNDSVIAARNLKLINENAP